MILAISSETGFFMIWGTFVAFSVAGAVAVVIWAIRHKQFSDQDRARYLPLQSGIPRDDEPGAVEGADDKGRKP